MKYTNESIKAQVVNGLEPYIDSYGTLWTPIHQAHSSDNNLTYQAQAHGIEKDGHHLEGTLFWDISNHETENEDETCNWDDCEVKNVYERY